MLTKMFFKTLLYPTLLLLKLVNSAPKEEEQDDPKEGSGLFLKHFKFNHLSGIKSIVNCSDPYSYMIGAQIRTSNYLNQTFNSITGMKIVCSNRGGQPAYSDQILSFDKNIGEWGKYEYCPSGQFAYGLVIHLQSINSYSLVADEEYDDTGSSARLFDIFELGRGRFISGLTINCSAVDEEEKFDSITPNNSVTLGWNSGFGLRIFCVDEMAVVGISIVKETLISYDEGERMIPVKLVLDCTTPIIPGARCMPELAWESNEEVICFRNNGSILDLTNISAPDVTNGSEKMDSHFWNETFLCNIKHHVGTTLNSQVDNIDEIKIAYNTSDVVQNPGLEVISKFLNIPFRNAWVNKYNLPLNDYEDVVARWTFTKYSNISDNMTTTLKVNANSDEFFPSPLRAKVGGKRKLKHKIFFSQLVSYCGFIKTFFPYFKAELRTYFDVDIKDIHTKVLLTEKEILINPGIDKI